MPSQRASLIILGLLLLLAALGCTSVGRLVVAATPTPTATVQATLRPTNTVTPTPTLTPTPTWTPSPVPTDTPTFTPTPVQSITPTATPEPNITQALALRPSVNVRSGPGVGYDLVGTISQDAPYDILATNGDRTWWKICCINGNLTGWVRGDLVQISGPVGNVPLDTAIPPVPPTPEPTLTPTPEPPTSTPAPLFYRGIGPIFMPTNNEYLTIWGKVYRGATGDGIPAPGWRIQVRREGQVVATSEPSLDVFQYSAPPNYGNRQLYNIKLEILDPGTASWQVYLIDNFGTIQSPMIDFTTSPVNPNREIYIGFLSAQ